MAERPQRAIGKAVVVTLFLFARQPDAAQRVRRLVRRYGEMPALVDRLVIAASASVRDPDTARRAHDRIERRHEPACGANPRDLAGRIDPVMDIGLAVRDDDDAYAAEALFEQRDKSIAGPLRLATGCIGG